MENILFTRQKHEAERAGTHYDIRLVSGDVAYSFATKKEMPELGKSIILWEQPLHDAAYALSEEVHIPKGQYGAGVTRLDFVRKAKIDKGEDHWTISMGNEKYLLKPVPKFGEGAHLFKNLGTEKEMNNKYLEKIAQIKIKESHEGKLHAELGIPQGEKIPESKLEAAARNAGPAEKKRIVFAENAKKWHHE